MVDYSKWKNIELSDDEDDTHPNIDTGSLFRWRHQARVERMTEQEKEKEQLQKKHEEHQKRMREIKQKLNTADMELDMSKMKLELSELEKQEEEYRKKEEELEKKERLQPWNVDTISKDGFTKTVINKPVPRKKEEMTEEEREEKYRKFSNENGKLIKEYGMLRKFEDSKKFLLEYPHLACDETANYLVMWCIGIEMDGKTELMEHVSHQCICMQFILELAKQLDCDPRTCISPFFSRIQLADQVYRDGFEDELRAFRERVRARAVAKKEQLAAEIEDEERQQRLGPGGMDPVEVFESLPVEMQDCFEKREIGLLQQVIANMPEDQAKYHMKRCIDSGLWVPDAKTAAQGEAEEPPEQDKK